MTNEPLVQETESLEFSPSLETVSETVIEPIYKHKDGRVFTKSQLIKDGLDETRIKTGLDSKMIIQIGDTEDPTQEFKHKDGRILTVKQLADDGVTADRISNGISMGLITPLEKKNQIQDASTTSSENLQAGASDSTISTDNQIPAVGLGPNGENKPKKPAIISFGSTETTKIGEYGESNDIINLISKSDDFNKKLKDAYNNESMIEVQSIQGNINEINKRLKELGIDENQKTKIKEDLSDFPFQSKRVLGDEKYSKVPITSALSDIKEISPSNYEGTLAQYKISYLIDKKKGKDAGDDWLYNFKSLNTISDLNNLEQNTNESINKAKSYLGVDAVGTPTDDNKKATKLISDYANTIVNTDFSKNKINEFIQDKLNGKEIEPNTTSAIGTVTGNPTAYTKGTSLDEYNLNSIADNLDLNNPVQKAAFEVYAKGRSLQDALGKKTIYGEGPQAEQVVYNGGKPWTNTDFEAAAIRFASIQNPEISKQIEVLGGFDMIPDSMKGTLVQAFLNNPDVIEETKKNQELSKVYANVKNGLYVSNPDFAKKDVSQIISQGMEDLGETNWLVNTPTQAQVDGVVDRLLKQGKLNESQVQVYKDKIRDDIGVLQSVWRGITRIPFGAFVEKSPIQTGGILENTQDAFNETIKGYAKSITDMGGSIVPSAMNILPSSSLKENPNLQRVYNILDENYKNLNINYNLSHTVSAGTGNIIGFTIPMIAGTMLLKNVPGGMAINNILAFEGHNRDNSLLLFPDNTTKQALYTLVSTAGDAVLADLLPTEAISKTFSKAFKQEAAGIVNNLLDGKITENIAKQQLKELTNVAVSFLGKNAKTTTVMTSFGIFHDIIDKISGSERLKNSTYGDLVLDKLKEAKTTFLTTPVLTILEMKGAGTGSVKANYKILWEISKDPAKFEKLITENTEATPQQKEEMIANLKIVDGISKDLQDHSLDFLNERQKQKYLANATAKKIFEEKGKQTTDDTLKKSYQDKAKEKSKILENILKGTDKAEELNTYDISEDEKLPKEEEGEDILLDEKEQQPVPNAEEIITGKPAKPVEIKEQTEIEKLRAQEQTELDSKIENAEQYRVDGKVDRTKLTNEEDIKAFDEVYDKYDKLITPLLKETEIATPVSITKVETIKQTKDNQPEFTTSSGRQKVNRIEDKLVVTDAKTGKEVSKKTYNKAIREYADNFDFTHGEEGESTTQSQDVNKILREVVENSNNPHQIAQIYAENDIPFTETEMTKDGMIAEYGLGNMSLESYRRFGDINKLTKGIRANYFAKKGDISIDIDSQAKDISEHYYPNGDGTEISPQDIVEFMEQYDTRKKLDEKFASKNPLLVEAKDKFKKLTGLDLTKEIANKALEQKIEKESQAEQNLLKQDYENAKQFEDEYWKQYEATDGFTKEAVAVEVNKGKERAAKQDEGVIAEFKEPKTADERSSLVDRLRSAKIKSDKLFDATIGLPIAVWNGAVELVAKSIEGGMLVADAIKRGINYIEKNHRGKWDKKAYNDKVIEALGLKGININGEDVIAKPMLDKQSADVINGFYSPLEQGILDTKLEKTTGKEWAKKLEGTTEGDELRFTGMSDFLVENADKTLTKQEVLDYMKNNRIELVEVVKGAEKIKPIKKSEIKNQINEYNYFDSQDGIVITPENGKYSVEINEIEEKTFDNLDEAIDYVNNNSEISKFNTATKYSEYQLPGEKSNYKEVLITLPNQGIRPISKWEFYENEGYTEKEFLNAPKEFQKKLFDKWKEATSLVIVNKKEQFKSSHYDEPNILAHIRMNTRVDAKGNKVLHIEEFQSDWGQKGKKQGFKKGISEKDIEVKFIPSKVPEGADPKNYPGYWESYDKRNGQMIVRHPGNLTEKQVIKEALDGYESFIENRAIPEGPFITETSNWTKLAWKVAVKEAVKEGAEKITWTTGEQQNARYDLSKSVDYIRRFDDRTNEDRSYIDISTPTSLISLVVDNRINKGLILESKNSNEGNAYVGKNLEDVIGKDIAEKAMNLRDGQELSGEGLKLGGTGMKGFYGSPTEGKLGIVGEVAKSLFKQEPKTTELGGNKGSITRAQALALVNDGKRAFTELRGEEYPLNTVGDVMEANNYYVKDGESQVQSIQHSIDITPEIIQGVKEGMSMFKSPFQKTADFFRKGKIGNDIAMGTIPFLKEVWNGALEVAAKTAELTGDSVKAIKDAVKYIKSTDWYKSLSTSDKDSMVNHFIDEHIDLLPKGKESLDLSVDTQHPYLYRGSTEKRVSGLMRHMMESENVSDATKADLKRNGIDYAIANNEEARKTASEIVDAFGEEDALRIAEQTDMHPSVRSAIFAETIDRAYSREKNATTDGEKIEAAEQWKDRVNAYDKLLTAGGQFTAYVNHFYGTSPLGFVMRENENTQGRFNEWFKDKEPTYQELLDALNETAEGKTFIADEVERIVKEERKQRREKRDKNIEDFFDKAKLQGGTYLTVIPPGVWNGAMDAMKAAVKAGDRVSDAVQRAIETISAQIGNNWDKEKFRKEYEGLLAKVADGDKKEAEKQDLASVYERRKKELERRLTNKDFSAEEYKDKKTLSDKEQAAKEEYNRIKKLYDEEKKKSPEWQDKKAKQFLDKFRDRMKGLDDKQKEEVVRKSIKKLAETGALREEEFRKIVAETIGFKDLTDTQVKQIEDLTKTINSLSDVEDAMVANPNEKTIADYKKAKEDAIQAGLDLYNIIHKKSDVISTIKSLITGSLLSVPTLIKNVAQNIIMQGFIRFPREVVRQIGELGVYGTTWIGNKLLGTKMYEPTSNLLKAQKGYFKGYLEGIKRGWFNFKRGTQEQDYFGKTSYQSTLAPRQALKDLKLWRSGEKFLTKGEVADRWIRASIFARQADFILRGMGFGDRPQRFAAERAKAIQIATGELKLVGDSEILAFEQSPQKMAYKILVDAGVNKVEALQRSLEIEERIKQEGSKAVLEEENLLSMASGYIEKGLAPNKENPLGIKGVKAVGSVAKTLTFPFIKIPGNVYWQMFKLFNPEVSIGQALWHSGEALNYSKKGDNASARQSIEKAKDSMSMAFLGLGLATAATTLVSQGYIRSNPSQDDAAKVRAGQRLFGKQNQINLGRLMGGEDYWVDLAWLGPIGAELDIKNRLAEDKIKDNLKGKEEPSPFGEWWNGLEYSAAAALNQLVFDQGARTVNAMKDGQNGAKIWFVNTMNTFENIFTGATYAAISKAMLPEEPRLRGDGVTDELLNNVKQRNVLVRLVLGRPPAKISMWGEPIKKDNSISGVMGNILGWEKGSANQFGSILYDDYRKTKDSRFFPPVEDNKLKIDDKDVEITQAEKDDLEVFIGKARKQLVSAFVYDSSLPYKVSVQAPDENGNMITKGEYKHYSNLTEDQRAEALTQIYKQGKETGYAQFLEKYPQYTPAKLTSKELGAQIKKEAYNEKFKFDMEKLLKNK